MGSEMCIRDSQWLPASGSRALVLAASQRHVSTRAFRRVRQPGARLSRKRIKDALDTGANWRVLVLSPAHHRSRLSDSVKSGNALTGSTVHNAAAKRILKIQASLTAHWHDKGADWRGLAHTQAHHRSRLSDSVKNGNALRTMHNAALPAR